MTLSTKMRNAFQFIFLAALGATLGGGNVSAEEGKLKFYVNFIGGPEIQFFALVKRGVDEAGKDLGVEAIYSAPKCCDINLQTAAAEGECRCQTRRNRGRVQRSEGVEQADPRRARRQHPSHPRQHRRTSRKKAIRASRRSPMSDRTVQVRRQGRRWPAAESEEGYASRLSESGSGADCHRRSVATVLRSFSSRRSAPRSTRWSTPPRRRARG